MPAGRPKTPLVVMPEEREQLVSLTRSTTLPAGLVKRAQIVLLSDQGLTNQAISRKLDVSAPTVKKWRDRFIVCGIEGLYDALRPGRPRALSDDQIADLLRTVIETKPANATHWSCRALAAETGISKSTVHQVCRLFGLKPHRQREFKLSTDPLEPVAEVTGKVGFRLQSNLVVVPTAATRRRKHGQDSTDLGWDSNGSVAVLGAVSGGAAYQEAKRVSGDP